MSFYTRPDRLRIPSPTKKKSQPGQDSASADASGDAAPAQPSSEDHEPLTEKPSRAAATAPDRVVEPAEAGSALEAWGGPALTDTSTAPLNVQAPGANRAKTSAPKVDKKPPKASAQTSTTPRKTASQKSSSQSKAQAQTEQQNREAHSETRILVIENDVEAADRVINILESDGYAVEIATDATYGTMLAQTFLPHLILLGALSEQLSGADFMRSLRNTTGFAERSQVTPVLYLIDSSQLLQQRFQGLRDTPLTSTIFKPANERELLQKIERALSPETDFPTETL